jgi:ribosomal-protein-alanine N-acetyltransferase
LEVAEVFADLPPLETERLLLRRARSEDVAAVFAYASDPEVARHTTWEAHGSPEASRAFVESLLARYAAGEVANWMMVLKAEGCVVGSCGFVYWNPHHHRAEIGYALARRLWGMGLMTEAVRRVCDFGFDVMGCNRIEARCLVENVRSSRVLEKAGMTFEGVIREQMYVKGAYRDLRLYSVLRRERPVPQGHNP